MFTERIFYAILLVNIHTAPLRSLQWAVSLTLGLCISELVIHIQKTVLVLYGA